MALLAYNVEARASTSLKTVLFDTAGFYEPIAKSWVVPVHAWVYEPQTSAIRKSAIAALFKRHYGLEPTAEHQATFDERINLLLADNKRGRATRVTFAPGSPQSRDFTLPRTGSNGHTRIEIVAKTEERPTVGLAQIALRDEPSLSAKGHLLPPTGVSIICDIDDTVKDTGVLDKRRLWESTFFKPFAAVPGMATLLKRLAGDEGGLHYVSSSPWHLYQPLRAWLNADGFPVSSLHLKHIRLKDSTVLNILKSPEETKPPVISEILRRFPQRTFILIGDSGEKDPEVYGAMARQFKSQVARILIRRAPGDTTGAARFAAAFANLSRDLWQVFDDPAEVR